MPTAGAITFLSAFQVVRNSVQRSCSSSNPTSTPTGLPVRCPQLLIFISVSHKRVAVVRRVAPAASIPPVIIVARACAVICALRTPDKIRRRASRAPRRRRRPARLRPRAAPRPRWHSLPPTTGSRTTWTTGSSANTLATRILHLVPARPRDHSSRRARRRMAHPARMGMRPTPSKGRGPWEAWVWAA